MAKKPAPLTRPASTKAADVQAFIKAKLAEVQKRTKTARRGHLKPLEYSADPLAGVPFTGENVTDLNLAVAATVQAAAAEVRDAPEPVQASGTGPVVPEARVPHDPELAAKIAGQQRRAAQTKQVWKRTTDRQFYFVCVFDAGNQARAFLESLKLAGHLTQDGDRFIDGRALADSLGIKIPEPEYPMTVNLKEPKASRTKRAKKIGKG